MSDAKHDRGCTTGRTRASGASGAPASSSRGEAELFRPGDTLDAKFVIERKLGEGAMGVVYLATHRALQARVALKFLRRSAVSDPESFLRFEREARIVAKLKSEYVARVYDVGTTSGGTPYMVMEFVDGGDLATRVREGGALPVGEVVEYGLQVCEALAEAHAAGVIHRDLKPANLFAARGDDGRPHVKVLDFGVSKLALAGPVTPGEATLPAAADLSLTQTASLVGSPLYMSPEQIDSSREIDHRSDIWSLGVVLYELLTGERPFTAGSFDELRRLVGQHDAPSLIERRDDIPFGLEAVIQRCLERDRERRYRNVAELAAALAPFAPRRGLLLVERAWATLRRARMVEGEAPGSLSIVPSVAPPERIEIGTGPALSAVSLSARPHRGRARVRLAVGFVGVLALGLLVAERGLAMHADAARDGDPRIETATPSSFDPTGTNASRATPAVSLDDGDPTTPIISVDAIGASTAAKPSAEAGAGEGGPPGHHASERSDADARATTHRGRSLSASPAAAPRGDAVFDSGSVESDRPATVPAPLPEDDLTPRPETMRATTRARASLDAHDILSVVNADRPRIKQACWERAYADRRPGMPDSASVSVSLTIGDDGRVVRASSTGGDAFPGLSACIVRRVRAWVFPASLSTTDTSVTYSYAAVH